MGFQLAWDGVFNELGQDGRLEIGLSSARLDELRLVGGPGVREGLLVFLQVIFVEMGMNSKAGFPAESFHLASFGFQLGQSGCDPRCRMSKLNGLSFPGAS